MAISTADRGRSGLTRNALGEAARSLAARDRDLAGVLQRHGPPPLWARPQGFATLVRIILEQQVSLASAAATCRRLERGVAPFTPERFAALGPDRLRALGVTRQKAAYCVHLAEAIVKGDLDLRAVGRMDDDGVAAALTRLKGIGPWTAEIYLLMALKRPDVWPAGDLALALAMQRVKRLRARPDPARMTALAESWRPYRAVAARMLWQNYLAIGRKISPSRGA